MAELEHHNPPSCLAVLVALFLFWLLVIGGGLWLAGTW
jgi:hypothetical protein